MDKKKAAHNVLPFSVAVRRLAREQFAPRSAVKRRQPTLLPSISISFRDYVSIGLQELSDVLELHARFGKLKNSVADLLVVVKPASFGPVRKIV